MKNRTRCRACGGPLRLVLDLGHSPLANALTSSAEEARSLPWYPLRMCSCAECMMVQLDVAVSSEELFNHYVYETPRAASLEAHYAALIDIAYQQHELIAGKSIHSCYEMGSNNGEFLRSLKSHRSIDRILGIEPAANIVELATAQGIPTVCEFFNQDNVAALRKKHGPCDLFVARHCMAHLDDLRGTLEAIAHIVADDGLVVIENAYVYETLKGRQFDQIYHEHMSYFAATPMKRLLESCGLYLRTIMLSPVHGGSLVLMASKKPPTEAIASIDTVLADEARLPDELESFAFGARACIAGLRAGLADLQGKVVDTYGATAKGNTLMNALGLGTVVQNRGLVRYAVDSTPSKQGKFLPGTGIRVISEAEAQASRPDIYLLTAWNYAAEIIAKNSAFVDGGGRWVVPLPFPRLVAKAA